MGTTGNPGALFEESRGESWWVRLLLPVLAVLWLGELAAPIAELLRGGPPLPRLAAALVGTALFAGLYLWAVAGAVRERSGAPRPPARPALVWAPTAGMALLAIAIAVGFGPSWLGLFIFAAVGTALRLPARQAGWTIAALTLAAGLIGLAERMGLAELAQGGLLVGGIGASVATVRYTIATTRQLRAARAELARLAVAEERLRFARDLHDLLGHSLSLVALKCDLAEQLVAAAPDRARQEIHQAADVTRGALREVREAVAGYRRPSLAAELAGAQEMLAAAGIGCLVEGEPPPVAAEAEGALAWALREAVTNVIRHSRARRCEVRLRRDGGRAELEVVDDGRGRAAGGGDGKGNGLAGLAERLAAAGGGLGVEDPGRGFRLRAWVPVGGGSR